MRPILVSALVLVAAACAKSGAAAPPAAAPAPSGGSAATAPTPAPARAPSTTPAVSAATTPTAATTRVVTGAGSTMQVNTMNIDVDVKLFVVGTVDEAWAVLPAVYQELGIPLSMNDNVRKTLGNTGWRTRRSIGRVPAQRYLDCGSSGTLENAETYQLNLSIVTSILLHPNGGSVVSTALSGTGKNPITSSSAEVRCASKGDLEIRIRDMVQKALNAR